MRTTVLIVDDHDDFRASASALLEAEGFAVLGEAADGGAAIVESERLRPDVVLLDIQLPDVDGFTVAERLAVAPEPPAVVLISSREAESYGPRLDAAAAQGFISTVSPIGQALMGKEEGDTVKVKTPTGWRNFEISRIKTIHDKE